MKSAFGGTSIGGVFRDRGDWLSLVLMVLIYALWVWLLFFQTAISGWVLAIVLAPLLTLHSSLQHEFMHGHPFKAQTINDVFASISIGILVPYFRFKDTHLFHHTDARLCDPYDDPESWYQAESDWKKRSAISQAIFNFNNTLVGRMLLGPAIGMTGFAKCEFRQFINGQWHIGWKWALHMAIVAIVLAAIKAWGSLTVTSYLFVAYAGMSLLMVRTFIEHQLHEKMRGRSVIIETQGLFSLLFLNNNFHAVHHAYPGLAWYRLPRLFKANREKFLKMNDGYRYANYLEVFRKHGLRRKEPVPFPEHLRQD